MILEVIDYLQSYFNTYDQTGITGFLIMLFITAMLLTVLFFYVRDYVSKKILNIAIRKYVLDKLRKGDELKTSKRIK